MKPVSQSVSPNYQFRAGSERIAFPFVRIDFSPPLKRWDISGERQLAELEENDGRIADYHGREGDGPDRVVTSVPSDSGRQTAKSPNGDKWEVKHTLIEEVLFALE